MATARARDFVFAPIFALSPIWRVVADIKTLRPRWLAWFKGTVQWSCPQVGLHGLKEQFIDPAPVIN